VRLFTTFTEVKDPLVVASFPIALVLNVVLGIQLCSYYGLSSSGVGVNTAGGENTEGANVELKELRELGNGSGRPAATQIAPRYDHCKRRSVGGVV
jgi:mannose-P-dolichol utilization defect protein 1